MRCASVRRTFLDGVPGDAAELLVARKASMLRGGLRSCSFGTEQTQIMKWVKNH